MVIQMEWIKVTDFLPKEEGVYLCNIEDSYGIFEFKAGRFLPNDWSDYTGTTQGSSFLGYEYNIIAWAHLPAFCVLTKEDRKLLKERKKLLENSPKVYLIHLEEDTLKNK